MQNHYFLVVRWGMKVAQAMEAEAVLEWREVARVYPGTRVARVSLVHRVVLQVPLAPEDL